VGGLAEASMRLACLAAALLAAIPASTVACGRPADHNATPHPPAGDPQRRAEDSVKPPENALQLCSGHVTGAPPADGSAAAHVTWDAYTSRDDTLAVATGYLNALGPDGHETEGPCHVWRIPPHQPNRVLQVCPLGAPGPWSSCTPVPASASSVILLSTRAVVDDPNRP
jgi:hypothetical protein